MKIKAIILEEAETIYCVLEKGTINSFWTKKEEAEKCQDLFQAHGVYSEIHSYKIDQKELPIKVGVCMSMNPLSGKLKTMTQEELSQQWESALITQGRQTRSWPSVGLANLNLSQYLREVDGELYYRLQSVRNHGWRPFKLYCIAENSEEAIRILTDNRTRFLSMYNELKPTTCIFCKSTSYKDIDSPLTAVVAGKWACSNECFHKAKYRYPWWGMIFYNYKAKYPDWAKELDSE